MNLISKSIKVTLIVAFDEKSVTEYFETKNSVYYPTRNLLQELKDNNIIPKYVKEIFAKLDCIITEEYYYEITYCK